jgi:hypothetical protein
MFKQSQLTPKLRRSVSYPGRGSPVFLPKHIWHQTLMSLSQYRPASSECLVYWGGVIGARKEYLITSLLRPNHTFQGWRVQLNSSETKSLLRMLRMRDEKLLVQIHSHPGEAFHSPGDDDLATSFHKGFLSIVVPNFAKSITLISECAVYEFTEKKFVRLTAEQVVNRFTVYDQVVDLSTPFNERNGDLGWRKDGEN